MSAKVFAALYLFDGAGTCFDMMRGVRASSISTESASSTTQKPSNAPPGRTVCAGLRAR